MNLAWFHCFSGIAGDMALGSLIDAGADVDEVCALLRRLPVTDWSLDVEPVRRGGIAATQVHVHGHDHTVTRTAAHIQGLLEEARLPERLRHRAQVTFTVLAEVEGRLHRRPPEQVHFHEVGGVDAIVDVVGSCAALEVLNVHEVHASPVTVGLGMVRTAHGPLPNPAPAVVDLLRGAPTHGVDSPVELTTPTGAALLAALCVGWGPMPPMRIEASGFGAGSRDTDERPNLTQVVLGQSLAAAVGGDGEDGQPAMQFEVNVDDISGEVLAHAVAALLDAGAHDAWVTPIVMKKGRPAYTVSVVADTAVAEQVAGVLLAETGSLGIRGRELRRWPRPREARSVEVGGLPVRVKVSPGRVKVEHDDAARVARRTGRPLREVLVEAEQRGAADSPAEPGTAPSPAPAALTPVPSPEDDAS